MENAQDGKIKLYEIHKALVTKMKNPELFTKGEYKPLRVEGKFAKHLSGFFRQKGNDFALTVAPIILSSLPKRQGKPTTI